jgi:redox-sensitive bicupin YhaK (pirin superfamily)
MPLGNKKGQMHGFQLWANLPSSQKMVTPRYQDVDSSNIPLIEDNDGSKIKIIVGDYKGIHGPVDGIAAEPQYFDIYIPPFTKKEIAINAYRNCFAYIFQGSADFEYSSKPIGVRVEKELNGEEINIRDFSGNRTLVNFDTGDSISLMSGADGVRFLLISGKPIQEPVAWHGPIVMNTQAELAQAFKELQNGTFIKPLH